MDKRLAVIGGMGLGAGLMFLLDPEMGRRRRKLAGDRARAWGNDLEEGAEKKARHLGNRAKGVVAETRGLFRRAGGDGAEEEPLSELAGTAESAGPLRFIWEHPTEENHWMAGERPGEGPAIEDAIREALSEKLAGEQVSRDLLVRLRRDGARWRIQAEDRSADLGPSRQAHDLTLRAVQAVRALGMPAEPGFSGDPSQPALRVGPVE